MLIDWALEEITVMPVVPGTKSSLPVWAPEVRLRVAERLPVGRSGSSIAMPVPLRVNGVCSTAV